MKKLIASFAILVAAASAHGITYTFNPLDVALDPEIPDGSIFLDTRIVPSGLGILTDVNVLLNIEGDYAGDLYAYLYHDGSAKMSVLLNRIGRTSSGDFGYSGGNLNLILDDQASVDVHDVNAPGWSPTGTLQPDGRNATPAAGLLADPRDFLLDQFDNIDPAGEWSLFISDESGLGTSKVVSWGLEFTTASATNVPDQISFAGAFALLGLWLTYHCKARNTL